MRQRWNGSVRLPPTPLSQGRGVATLSTMRKKKEVIQPQQGVWGEQQPASTALGHACFAAVSGAIAAGRGFCEVLPDVYMAYCRSPNPTGEILRNGCRVPYPLVDNSYAWPADATTAYPSDHLFPVPMPPVDPLPPRGRKRERAGARMRRAMLMSVRSAH